MAIKNNWCPFARAFCKGGKVFITDCVMRNVDHDDPAYTAMTDEYRAKCRLWNEAKNDCRLVTGPDPIA